MIYVCLKVVLILADNADPDEMQHHAAFHLGLHCFSKYLFRRFQYTKRYNKYDAMCGKSTSETVMKQC